MEGFETDIKKFRQCFYGLKDNDLVIAFIEKLQKVLKDGFPNYCVDWVVRDILSDIEYLAISSFLLDKKAEEGKA